MVKNVFSWIQLIFLLFSRKETLVVKVLSGTEKERGSNVLKDMLSEYTLTQNNEIVEGLLISIIADERGVTNPVIKANDLVLNGEL